MKITKQETIEMTKKLCKFFGLSEKETEEQIKTAVEAWEELNGDIKTEEVDEYKKKYNKTYTNRPADNIQAHDYKKDYYNIENKLDILQGKYDLLQSENKRLRAEIASLEKQLEDEHECCECCDCCSCGEDEVCIDRVSFNEKKRTTSITFDDGEKVTVRAHDEDDYDKYVGFAMAYVHHLFGSRTKFRKFVDGLEGQPNVYYVHGDNNESK